ncbi:hypothetical protein [Rhizobium mongolense]|nr:hypothetical protein [Rhizobium mongolense]MBB4227326.1 hypothetical protein [Rhizobium mongolense]
MTSTIRVSKGLRYSIEHNKHCCRACGHEAARARWVVARPDNNWKPYPCLLTRRELKAIIAKQLG